MNLSINDRFMKPDAFGYTKNMSFHIDPERENRADIPLWKIRRSNARSMGRASFTHTKPCKACGSLEKRAYDLKCMPCFILEKKK